MKSRFWKQRKPLVAITTYNREESFLKVSDSIDLEKVDVIIFKDGGGEKYHWLNGEDEFVTIFEENKGIGYLKNEAVKYAIKNNYQHLFIIEDDVEIIVNKVWEECIKFRKETGILHFNWNTCAENKLKDSINGIDIHKNVQGAFSYFDVDCFTKHGIEFDLNYKNAYEHVDIEYQMIQKKLLPSFWNFVSPSNLDNFLKNIDEGKSTITGQEGYSENYKKSHQYWIEKWGKPVKDIPDRGLERSKLRLEKLREEFGTPLPKTIKSKSEPISVIACIRDRCHFRYTSKDQLHPSELKVLAAHDKIINLVYEAQHGMGGVMPNQLLMNNPEGFRPFDHFLKTLSTQADSFDGDIELVIVDYESEDDDVEDLIQLYWGKDYQYIPLPRERKFSRGYALHQGIQKAKYERLHITDIDMTYWTPRALEEASKLEVGKTAIFPQIMKEESPSSLKLFAETAGFGIASFGKSDYEKTNGYIDKSEWGGEDTKNFDQFVELLGKENVKRTLYRDCLHQWHSNLGGSIKK